MVWNEEQYSTYPPTSHPHPHPPPHPHPSPGQYGRHFADDIFRCIVVNESFFISIKILLKYIPKGPIDNNPALV